MCDARLCVALPQVGYVATELRARGMWDQRRDVEQGC